MLVNFQTLSRRAVYMRARCDSLCCSHTAIVSSKHIQTNLALQCWPRRFILYSSIRTSHAPTKQDCASTKQDRANLQKGTPRTVYVHTFHTGNTWVVDRALTERPRLCDARLSRRSTCNCSHLPHGMTQKSYVVAVEAPKESRAAGTCPLYPGFTRCTTSIFLSPLSRAS